MLLLLFARGNKSVQLFHRDALIGCFVYGDMRTFLTLVHAELSYNMYVDFLFFTKTVFLQKPKIFCVSPAVAGTSHADSYIHNTSMNNYISIKIYLNILMAIVYFVSMYI